MLTVSQEAGHCVVSHRISEDLVGKSDILCDIGGWLLHIATRWIFDTFPPVNAHSFLIPSRAGPQQLTQERVNDVLEKQYNFCLHLYFLGHWLFAMHLTPNSWFSYEDSEGRQGIIRAMKDENSLHLALPCKISETYSCSCACVKDKARGDQTEIRIEEGVKPLPDLVPMIM